MFPTLFASACFHEQRIAPTTLLTVSETLRNDMYGRNPPPGSQSEHDDEDDDDDQSGNEEQTAAATLVAPVVTPPRRRASTTVQQQKKRKHGRAVPVIRGTLTAAEIAALATTDNTRNNYEPHKKAFLQKYGSDASKWSMQELEHFLAGYFDETKGEGYLFKPCAAMKQLMMENDRPELYTGKSFSLCFLSLFVAFFVLIFVSFIQVVY